MSKTKKHGITKNSVHLNFGYKQEIRNRCLQASVSDNSWMAPPAGLEPATSWLTVMRSTDWAKEEYRPLVFTKVYALPNKIIRGDRYCERDTEVSLSFLCQQWAIFPARLQASIVATAELNFRVRNGNGWTLCVKITDLMNTVHGWTKTCSLKTEQSQME